MLECVREVELVEGLEDEPELEEEECEVGEEELLDSLEDESDVVLNADEDDVEEKLLDGS